MPDSVNVPSVTVRTHGGPWWPAAPGLIHAPWTRRREPRCCSNFRSEHLRRQGYKQVFTPHIGRLDLYKTSGHFPYYMESQFPPIIDREFYDGLPDREPPG